MSNILLQKWLLFDIVLEEQRYFPQTRLTDISISLKDDLPSIEI